LETLIPLSTGVAIVLPVAYIAEAVNQPILLEMRKAIMGMKRALSGFVPDGK
jgi:hypothetical protein